MAIVINGSGTVTGISVGGLPDGIVDNGTMADDAIAIADLAATGTASNSTFLRGDNSWATAGVSVLGSLTDVSMDITNFVDSLLIQPDSDGSAPTTGTLSSASDNIGIGKDVFAALTSGTRNVAIGKNALLVNTTGAKNVALGYAALEDNTTGDLNVAIGHFALSQNTTADNNVAVGRNALESNTTGTSGTALGYEALKENTTADNNTAVGYLALTANTTGDSCVAVGKDALLAHTTGNNNAAVGLSSLDACTTGAKNTAMGSSSLGALTTGIECAAFGRSALSGVTTGTHNVGFGRSAGSAITTGTYNTCIGNRAGDNLTTGDNCIIIGSSAASVDAPESATADNQLNIGGWIKGVDGQITMPNQPAFFASMGSDDSNIAINAWHTVNFSSEIFDQNADFNTGTYTFTAPVTGRYQLNAIIRFENADTDHDNMYINITTSNREIYTLQSYKNTDNPPQITHNVNVLCDMDANDTAKVRVYPTGGSADTDIASSSTFSGYLAC